MKIILLRFLSGEAGRASGGGGGGEGERDARPICTGRRYRGADDRADDLRDAAAERVACFVGPASGFSRARLGTGILGLARLGSWSAGRARL
jgi:hypothetical protein